MKSSEIISLCEQYVMPTYGRYPLAFVRGQGARVWDAEGKEYLDFGGGIAVNVLGHAHPALAEALNRQSKILIHTSNLYHTLPQAELAKRLVELVGIPGKCFFCNSGGEANEALYKLARKFGHDGGRYELLTFTNSFHGRTLAGIAATGQEKVKKGFEPMVDGFRHVPFNDLDAVAQAIGPKTAAVLLEPVQGEGGIEPAKPEFLRGLRRLCDERGLLLLFDEVQCGLGRTGSFCGFQSIAPDVRPDGISWAKGLAGGFPIGAIWARAPYANVLGPGTHASTFGGTPLACAVALAVLDTIEKERLIQNAQRLGEYLLGKLRGVPGVKQVRGLGLMIGAELTQDNKPVLARMAEHGLLGVGAGTHVVRFLPPLNITRTEVDDAVQRFEAALNESSAG